MKYQIDSEWPEDAKKIEKFPGIRNKNLNCYVNSLMQAVFHLPLVYNYFEKYSCTCGNNCVYCLMKKDFFNKIKTSSNDTIEPEDLVKRVLEGKTGCKFGEQGWPIEFYVYLADKMKETKEDGISENFLEDIFDGQRETVTCCNYCGSKQKLKLSSSIFIFNDIPQSFKEKGFHEQPCMACQTSNVTEQNFIRKAPPVLRFQTATTPSKIRFPEKLDLSPSLNSNTPVMYELASIVIFIERDRHYIAMCKEPCGEWNEYNDTIVRPVGIKKVLKQKPYAVFYRRVTANVEEDINPEQKMTNKFKDLKVKLEEKSSGEVGSEVEGGIVAEEEEAVENKCMDVVEVNGELGIKASEPEVLNEVEVEAKELQAVEEKTKVESEEKNSVGFDVDTSKVVEMEENLNDSEMEELTEIKTSKGKSSLVKKKDMQTTKAEIFEMVVGQKDSNQVEKKSSDLQVSKKNKLTEISLKVPKKPEQQKVNSFKCKTCFKTYSSRYALNRHNNSHSGKKPFKCNHPNCGKSFLRKDNLKDHQTTHSNVKLFNCPSCGKDYKHKKSLKKHMELVHNGKKDVII